MTTSTLSSIRKNLKGILLVAVAALLTSVGQMFWKISAGTNYKWLILGFICYGIGAILMIIAFRFGSLSVLHPMLSLGYIFAIFLGNYVLKEHITTGQYFGVFIIIIGVVLLGGGDV